MPFPRKQRSVTDRPGGVAGRRRKRSLSTELTPLEARSLLAVVGLQVMAHPGTIGPPDGRTVEVTVMGTGDSIPRSGKTRIDDR